MKVEKGDINESNHSSQGSCRSGLTPMSCYLELYNTILHRIVLCSTVLHSTTLFHCTRPLPHATTRLKLLKSCKDGLLHLKACSSLVVSKHLSVHAYSGSRLLEELPVGLSPFLGCLKQDTISLCTDIYALADEEPRRWSPLQSCACQEVEPRVGAAAAVAGPVTACIIRQSTRGTRIIF